MSGKWIYEPENLHECELPKVHLGKHKPGSIWKCECGLEYVLTKFIQHKFQYNFGKFINVNRRKFVRSACGKGICVKQGGHGGNCSY